MELGEAMEPGDYCDDRREYVMFDGECWCNQEEE